MKHGVIAIIEEDKEYANRLMDYINRKNDFIYQAIVFSSKDSFLSGKNNKIDLYFICEELLDDFFTEMDNKIIFVLTKDPSKAGNTEPFHLFKYQSAEVIILQIMDLVKSKKWDNPINKLDKIESKTKVIGVFSPSNHEEQTHFSFLLGQEYATNKHTLYLNLEPFSTLSLYTDTDDEYCLSDLIYYLKQENFNLIDKLKSFILKNNNLDYITGIGNAFELFELTKEDMSNLMERLIIDGTYDIIILNIAYLHNPVLELFKFCDLLYFIRNTTRFSKHITEQFYHLLTIENCEKLADKIKIVTMPCNETIQGEQVISTYEEIDNNLDKAIRR